MVLLREVVINNIKYYYLFHVEKKKELKKYIRYIGKELPKDEELKELKKDFLKNLDYYERKKDKNVIEVLQKIQDKKGYIPEEEIVKISKEMNIPAVDLCGVVTFYSQFKFNQPGKYEIAVCRGTSCHVKKSGEILKFISEKLKIKEGETTSDGKFSLSIVNCLGACAKAPVMKVNDRVYGELTNEKVNSIIEGLE
jgi:NADH-quinone oxidoreductase E subunit